jgi:ribonuclease BN (tRNA processing enzyme)
MTSRITFLGTAGNLAVVNKQNRSSGGFVIRVDDFQMHIDPGPGALTNSALLGVNVREHSALLVSHAHLNHCNDLNALINAMTLNGLDSHGVLIAPESVVKGTNHIKPILHDHFAHHVEKIIIAQPGKKIGLEHIEIHPLFSKHSDPHALGFKIFTPEFALAYSGDTSFDSSLAEQYAGADILILNVQHPGKTKEPGLCSADVIKILKKAQPKLCIITHFAQKMLDAKPLYEAREIQRQSGIQVIAADDGMSINPAAYSAEAKQKTLNTFKEELQERTRQGSR